MIFMDILTVFYKQDISNLFLLRYFVTKLSSYFITMFLVYTSYIQKQFKKIHEVYTVHLHGKVEYLSLEAFCFITLQ